MGQEEAMLLVALAGVVGGAVGARLFDAPAWKGAIVAAAGVAAPIVLLAAFGLEESTLAATASSLIAICIAAAAFGFNGWQTVAAIVCMALAGGAAVVTLASVTTL